MGKQSKKFKVKIHHNHQLNQFLADTLNSLELGNTQMAEVEADEIDTIMMIIPDNTPDNSTYITPSDPIIHLTGSNNKINHKIKQNFPAIDIHESPLTAYQTIMKLLSDELHSENSDSFDEHKALINGASCITPKPYAALTVILHGKAQLYKDYLKFVLHSLFQQLKLTTELESGNMRILLYKLQENWILLGSYVNHYLKTNHLPDAELLTELSSARYEGSDNESRIYFTHDNIETITTFDSSSGEASRVLCNNNLRPIRKLIELSKRNVVHLYAALTNAAQNEYTITQLVRLNEAYSDENTETDPNKKESTDTYIKFSGFMHWSVVCGVKEVFSYYHGHYLLNPTNKETSYEADIAALQDVDNASKKMIADLIKILKKQKHGASVVISDFPCENDKSLIDDLCQMNYGIKLCPPNIVYTSDHGWDKELLLSLTDIDGALFIDLREKRLAAIGTLLYSKIAVTGDVGRGSRYNSMNNYIMEKKNGIYIGIVISEDGMINVIPNKRNRTKSSDKKTGA